MKKSRRGLRFLVFAFVLSILPTTSTAIPFPCSCSLCSWNTYGSCNDLVVGGYTFCNLWYPSNCQAAVFLVEPDEGQLEAKRALEEPAGNLPQGLDPRIVVEEGICR